MGHRRYNCILLFITLASILGVTVSTLNEFSIISYKDISEERGLELFEQWAKKHGKVYGCMEEKEKRLLNFIENLHYVLENNNYVKESGHQVGLNVFADMNNDEFKEVYTPKRIMKKKPNVGGESRASKVSCEAPMSLDWRKKGVVTGVKNQGQCGKCKKIFNEEAVDPSLQLEPWKELIDCDTTNEGCDGGYMDYAFEWVINNGGIDSESDYPYTGLDGVCNVTKEEIKLVTIDGYEDVDPSEGALLCAVVKQPISVGIDGSSLDFQLYTGGIYDGDCSSNPNDIDHAVLIVGYGSQGNTDYWIVKNSWGTSWGMEGYIYIKRNTELPYGNSGDKIGVAAKKRKLAKHKFPWTKSKETLNSDGPLLWKS
ncbi:Oryzain alpha chain [Acorus calamus]|uniref:Oryzain alpha chain n=1 Tax=Acorus calamus TaxID=4465 RepID=A0AAV9DRL2_ACOCL|nr:Oryzain alpha chain [Acorus calamus]